MNGVPESVANVKSVVTDADKAALAWRIRLDALASEANTTLAVAGIPSVLLKGPTTARWLYEPPRHYRDIDLLIPRSKLSAAVRTLRNKGIARPRLGSYGHVGMHSHTLVAAVGPELDLHVSLAGVEPPPDRDQDWLWRTLQPHVQPCELRSSLPPINALDEVARCLVLALHCVGDEGHGQPAQDLHLAVQKCSSETWAAARQLGEQLGVADLVDVAVAFASGDATYRQLIEAKQWHLPEPRHRWPELRGLTTSERLMVIGRRVVPDQAGLREGGWPADTTGQMVRSQFSRWTRIIRNLG